MKSDTDFIEKTVNSRTIYRGRLLNVFEDTVILPSGNHSTREYIKHPGAAVVIPYLGKNQIIMVRQYRYPTKMVMLELPAGKIDTGESPERTMTRELAEETGYHPNSLQPICTIHTCVGYSDELLHLFWASDLHRRPISGDDDEAIEVIKISIDDAIALVLRGEITDAKTLIGLFWLNEIRRNPDLRKKYFSG
jgi:ADP-ribose pyrophosphatase